jgi:hypothetical protein
MGGNIELQRRIIEYMREYYTSSEKAKMLPPSPDTLIQVLCIEDRESLNAEINHLIEERLVMTVSFHNWLDFTELGYETFII